MTFPTEMKFIEAAEQDLRVDLPAAFRTRLLANNGGQIEALEGIWELNPVFDTSDSHHIARTGSHIVSETTSAREWPGFPAGAVAVASDGGGNHLVFLPTADDASRLQATVFVWWHEGAELEIVAADFSEL
jgi:hypothetical protein